MSWVLRFKQILLTEIKLYVTYFKKIKFTWSNLLKKKDFWQNSKYY